MPNFSIKDVPEAWAEALRQRAERHHRSLQGELMAILERALTADESSSSPAGRMVGSGAGGLPVLRLGGKSMAQVRAELLARYPAVIAAQASSVALIREGRDSR